MKKLFFLCLVLLLSGCVNSRQPKFNDFTEITEANLQRYFEEVIVDANHPYGIDYVLKERLTFVEDIDNHWFVMTSPEKLTPGENQITLEVTYPNKQVSIVSFVMKCEEITYTYDVVNLRFDKETQTITGYMGVTSKLIIPEVIDGTIVKHIGEEAFLEKLFYEAYLPNTIETIGNRAFMHNMLTTFILPPSVKYVGEKAFVLNQFTHMELENRHLTFGDFVLANNPIESVVLKEEIDFSLLSANWVRAGLPIALLPGVKVHQGAYYREDTKTLYWMQMNPYQQTFANRINTILESLGIEHIGDYAFYGAQIAQFALPQGIKTIGKYAYANCPIYELTIPESVVSIADYAFSNTNLLTLTMSDGILSFGDNVFSENEIRTIWITGDETTYNDIWHVIGFEEELKPIKREAFDVIASWSTNNFVHLIDSIVVGDVIYGVGFTRGNSGEFAHNIPDIKEVYFLFSYDTITNTKKTRLLLEPAYAITSIVMGDNNTLLASGMLFIEDGFQYFPYLLAFDTDLSLVSAKELDLPIDMPHKIVVNDDGDLLMTASSKRSSPIDCILILTQQGDLLYQYTAPANITGLNLFDACSAGGDFVAVGFVMATTYTNTSDGNTYDAYSIRVNKHGVVWEVRHAHPYMKMHQQIIRVNDSFLIRGNINLTGPLDYTVYLLWMDANGSIIQEINTSAFDVYYSRSVHLVEDRIYLVATTSMFSVYSEIFEFDLSLQNQNSTPFIQLGHNTMILTDSSGRHFVMVDSSDRYLANNQIQEFTSLYVFLFETK